MSAKLGKRSWVFPVLLVFLGILASSLYIYFFELTDPRGNVGTTVEEIEEKPLLKLPLDYVGSTRCGECHKPAFEAWRNSHHDLAMQEANETSVLGDFNNASLKHYGVTSRFFLKDGRYTIQTDGPDGTLQDFEVVYTFGAVPLQQYIVAFPNGRYQIPTLAWDTRPEENGGQRWFHLQPDEVITSDDPLHWTRGFYNWNHSCAECHSTDVTKNYDAANQSFNTQWSEIDVGCEACHGPGTRHVAWAEQEPAPSLDTKPAEMELVVLFDERKESAWTIDPQTGNAVLSGRSKTRDVEIDTCAPCHSRRAQMVEGFRPGENLMQTHVPSLISGDLYFDDGQIREEVFVYASFLQSKMYAKGVTCADCHDAHALTLRAPGSQVCSQCHQAEKYQTVEHHHHPLESTGADCVECHMPATTYMEVDPRHDHSIRIPRPDLTQTIGTPNACNLCHADKTAEWSSDYITQWYPEPLPGFQNFAEALSAARSGNPAAGSLLVDVLTSPEESAMARAAALSELGPYLYPSTFIYVQEATRDRSALVRLGALRALVPLDPARRISVAGPLLNDPVLAVRTEAANLLSDAPANQIPAVFVPAYQKAMAEYEASQKLHLDRPDRQMNLGLLYAGRGDFEAAESAYRQAIALEPGLVRSTINLADLYRTLDREDEGKALLTDFLARQPEQTEANYALGLLLVREKQLPEALPYLEKASRNAATPHYSYVYGVALYSAGKTGEATEFLEARLMDFPGNQELLSALISFLEEQGEADRARAYAKQFIEFWPTDPVTPALRERFGIAD